MKECRCYASDQPEVNCSDSHIIAYAARHNVSGARVYHVPLAYGVVRGCKDQADVDFGPDPRRTPTVTRTSHEERFPNLVVLDQRERNRTLDEIHAYYGTNPRDCAACNGNHSRKASKYDPFRK